MRTIESYIHEGFYKNAGADAAVVRYWLEQASKGLKTNDLRFCNGRWSFGNVTQHCYVDLTDKQFAIFCEGFARNSILKINYNQLKEITILNPSSAEISIDAEIGSITFIEIEGDGSKAKPYHKKRRIMYIYDDIKHGFVINKQYSKF